MRSPVLNFTPQHGLGVKWALSDKHETCSGLVHSLNKKKNNLTEEGEANRLLYVALTRAQEHLILSWSQKEKEPKNWAKTVIQALDLSGAPIAADPAVKNYQAPNGRSFELRFIRTDAPPPPFLTAEGSRTASDAEALARPPLTDQLEPNTTATALSQFAACPRKYFLSSYLGWDGTVLRPRPAANPHATSARASDIGTQVHGLLAGNPPAAPDLEALRLAQVFENSPLGKRTYKSQHTETEWDFVFALHPLILRGTIDLWFEERHGLTLVDYKTDSVTPESAAERAADYTLQLQVYALALEKATGKLPVQAWLHFLRPDVALPVRTEGAAEAVGSVARAFVQAQESREFPLNPGAHCRRCEFFRNLCPGNGG
jgi:ATP-dependent exoDNAse (exonuclease V) beta subunit